MRSQHPLPKQVMGKNGVVRGGWGHGEEGVRVKINLREKNRLKRGGRETSFIPSSV